MRNHILTESERKIIKRYLDTGDELDLFKVFLPKVRSINPKALGEDLKLIASALGNSSDIGVALVELLAYVGDHLSAYQDAVATEAYLETARSRISVARHPRVIQTAGALELMLNIINEQVNVLHQDVERLYNEWFIEDTPPCSVPYVGDIKEMLGAFERNLTNFDAKMKLYLKKSARKGSLRKGQN
jgi:hypothetical protein